MNSKVGVPPTPPQRRDSEAERAIASRSMGQPTVDEKTTRKRKTTLTANYRSLIGRSQNHSHYENHPIA